ncbi:MAG: hypothetical protein LBV19_02200 [Streptococcaceae bacterium]|jgi:hypothetical protein|nr:hypothetical protein [Streptococcaceae bacterium]
MRHSKVLLGIAVALGALIMLGGANQASAATLKEVPGKYKVVSDDPFLDLSDDDKVLQLPEGGWLHGKCQDYSDLEMKHLTAEYDSETDENSITVKEARRIIKQREQKLMLKEDVKPLPLATYPPENVRTLRLHDSYTSNEFSGKGWRFAGLLFAPSNEQEIFYCGEAFAMTGA